MLIVVLLNRVNGMVGNQRKNIMELKLLVHGVMMLENWKKIQMDVLMEVKQTVLDMKIGILEEIKHVVGVVGVDVGLVVVVLDGEVHGVHFIHIGGNNMMVIGAGTINLNQDVGVEVGVVQEKGLDDIGEVVGIDK